MRNKFGVSKKRKRADIKDSILKEIKKIRIFERKKIRNFEELHLYFCF